MLRQLLLLCLFWATVLSQDISEQGYASNILEPNPFVPGDHYGRDIDVSQNAHWAVVGAPYSDNRVGAAYVYKREGKEWDFVTKLVPTVPVRGMQFGWSVSIDHTGHYIVVGSIKGDSSSVFGSGNAHVFYHEVDSAGQSKCAPLASVLEADNPGADDKFGGDLDIDGSGEWIVVGAFACCQAEKTSETDYSALRGAAYVFRREGSGASAKFARVQRLEVPVAERQPLGHFGQYIVISEDARTIAVGSWSHAYKEVGAQGKTVQHAGAVFVYSRSSSTAVSFAYEQRLTATTPKTVALFGSSLAIHNNRLAIGSRNHDAGDPTKLAAGVVYVFEFDALRDRGFRWYNPLNQSEREYVSPLTTVDGAKFGHAVAIYNDWLYVGTYDNTRSPPTSSNVYIFRSLQQLGQTTWSQVEALTDPSDFGKSNPNVAKYGYSLAVDGYYLALGALNDDTKQTNLPGYALVSVQEDYQCNGYGVAVGQGKCVCDYGYISTSSTSTEQAQDCFACDSTIGYYGEVKEGRLSCKVCNGHGTWNFNTGCLCETGWLSPVSGLPCSVCASGYGGPACAGLVELQASPQVGEFLTSTIILTPAGLDILNDKFNKTITYAWYFKKSGSNTTYSEFKLVNTTKEPSLTLPPSAGLPLGAIQFLVELSRNGLLLSNATTEIVLEAPVLDTVNIDATLKNILQSSFSLLSAADPGDATSVEVQKTPRENVLEAAFDLVKLGQGMAEEGGSAEDIASFDKKVATNILEQLNVSSMSAWTVNEVNNFASLLIQLASSSAMTSPEILSAIVDANVRLVNEATIRPGLDRTLVAELTDLTQVQSMGTQNAQQRKFQVLELVADFPYMQAQICIAEMNFTDTTSFSLTLPTSISQLECRRVVPTQQSTIVFFGDPLYQRANLFLQTQDIPQFQRHWVDLVATMVGSELVSAPTGSGEVDAEKRVAMVLRYGLYDRETKMIDLTATSSRGARIQLPYRDDLHSIYNSSYCKLYLLKRYVDGAWNNLAGCNETICQWYAQSEDPVCPPAPVFSTSSHPSRALLDTSAYAPRRVSKFQPQQVSDGSIELCSGPTNPYVETRYLCFWTPDTRQVSIYFKNGPVPPAAEAVDDSIKYKWDEGLLLLGGYGGFYALTFLVIVWGVKKDPKIDAKYNKKIKDLAKAGKSEKDEVLTGFQKKWRKIKVHNWLSVFSRAPGEPITTPQRAVILSTAMVSFSALCLYLMPVQSSTTTVMDAIMAAVISPVVGWIPSTVLRWTFLLTTPSLYKRGAEWRYRLMGLNPTKMTWFDKVELEVEAQSGKVIVGDDGDLQVHKGGANPYMKVLQTERKQQMQQATRAELKKSNRPSTMKYAPDEGIDGPDYDTEFGAGEGDQEEKRGNPLQLAAKPATQAPNPLTLPMGTMQRDSSRDGGRKPSLPASGTSSRHQKRDAQFGTMEFDVDGELEVTEPSTVAFVFGRVVEVIVLVLAVVLPIVLIESCPWYWPVMTGLTVVILAVSGALASRDYTRIPAALMVIWSLSFTAWVCNGLMGLPLISSVVCILFDLMLAMFCESFVHRTLRRPYNALMAYTTVHCISIVITGLLGAYSYLDDMSGNGILDAQIKMAVAVGSYWLLSILVILRLRLRFKGRLLPRSVPENGKYIGLFVAAPIHVACLFLVVLRTAQEDVNYSKMYFTIAFFLGCLFDFLVWEYIRVLLLALMGLLVKAIAYSSAYKAFGFISRPFLG